MVASAYVGTSGWNYPEWRDSIYRDVSRKDWLRVNASHFRSVEINATFYGSQRPETFRKWLQQVPDDFRFTMKGNRYLTHNKRLLDPREPVCRERDRSRCLGANLAAVVWQLPANFRRHDERLENFLKALRHWRRVRHVIEFRHCSWFDDTVCECLHRYRVAVCLSDAADWPIWDAVSTDLVYVRLHGHSRTYASGYAKRSLRRWAQRARQWLRESRDVHFYFDNTAEGHAPADATSLLQMLEER